MTNVMSPAAYLDSLMPAKRLAAQDILKTFNEMLTQCGAGGADIFGERDLVEVCRRHDVDIYTMVGAALATAGWTVEYHVIKHRGRPSKTEAKRSAMTGVFVRRPGSELSLAST